MIYWDILPRTENMKNLHNIFENIKSLRADSITPHEVFCKDFVDINYENA